MNVPQCSFGLLSTLGTFQKVLIRFLLVFSFVLFPYVSFTGFLWVLFIFIFVSFLVLFSYLLFQKVSFLIYFWKFHFKFKFKKCSSFHKIFPFSYFVRNFKRCLCYQRNQIFLNVLQIINYRIFRKLLVF